MKADRHPQIETKYKSPRCNSDFVGHKFAIKTLMQAVMVEKLSHAWLLSGPQGIGKATLAYRFTRYLLNLNGADKPVGSKCDISLGNISTLDQDPLWVEPSSLLFRKIASGSHPNLFSLERKVDEKGKVSAQITVDQVRLVNEFFRKTAIGDGWRVVIIDSVDDMNLNAANALLKILEEPPKKCLIMLISHNLSQLLPTILSRCTKLRFSRLSRENMDVLLEFNFPHIGDKQREFLNIIAEGRIGHAISLVDEGGLDVYEKLIDLLGKLPELDTIKLHNFVYGLDGLHSHDKFKNVMLILNSLLARLIRKSLNAETDDLPKGEQKLIQSLNFPNNLNCWLDVWERINNLVSFSSSVNLDNTQVILNTFHEIEDSCNLN